MTMKHKDIEIIRNTSDYFKTFFTIEIHTELTRQQAKKLAEKIYNLDII